MLVLMAQADGSPDTRDMLTREVWKLNSRVTLMDNVIDVHIARLRQKINVGFSSKLLETVRGKGYILQIPEIE